MALAASLLLSHAGSQSFVARPLLVRTPRAPLCATPRAAPTTLALNPLVLRGGALVTPTIASLTATPATTFNAVFVALCTVAALSRVGSIAALLKSKSDAAGTPSAESVAARALQLRFLPVFWLLRMADWLQGPYFYEVYASKVFNGQPASLSLVSKLFLTGFGATALFGPSVGRITDSQGRKAGTLAFALFYTIGALTTRSPLLWVLLLGRLAGGIGTSLLFSAPEAWLVGEAQRTGASGALGDTFGKAYAGDALVAIAAGQLASLAAGARGSSGPFELSVGFLAAGAVLAGLTWKENRATLAAGGDDKGGVTISDAAKVAVSDPKILLVGSVQALFEGAMYIFVLQWPPALAKGVAKVFGSGAATPFGAVFSCFMVCCLLGSTTFQALAARGVRAERKAAGTMGLAAAAMTGAAVSAKRNAMASLCAAFFAFELCVGLYFPTIGTLRSKYVPEGQRAIIMNLFGIPLNMLVVGCFLSIKKLGVPGALSVAAGALALAAAAAADLARTTKGDAS